MKLRGVSIAVCVAALAACSGRGSLAPDGWQPVGGAPDAWTKGAGPAQQRYTYVKRPFAGTLQDLASREAVDVVLQHRGAKFRSSDVFAACPGQAAVAVFTEGTRTLKEGFATQNGMAAMVTYERPSSAPDDSAVERAMQAALCTT